MLPTPNILFWLNPISKNLLFLPFNKFSPPNSGSLGSSVSAPLYYKRKRKIIVNHVWVWSWKLYYDFVCLTVYAVQHFILLLLFQMVGAIQVVCGIHKNVPNELCSSSHPAKFLKSILNVFLSGAPYCP